MLLLTYMHKTVLSFKRIAGKRTNEVLEKIRILGNCSNRSSCEYTAEEVNKIFSEIDRQIKLTKPHLTCYIPCILMFKFPLQTTNSMLYISVSL